MMLSPADYAAYSRQTGRAYPQSEEEKAEMYGEVRNFRENQLKGPSALETVGGIALGAGALAGIGAAAMKLRGRGKDPRMVSGLSKGKSGVQKADLSNMAAVRRVAEVDPQSVPTKTATRTEVYKNVATKPEAELPQVSRPQGAVEESMLVTDPNTGEVYRRGGGRRIRAEELRDEAVARVRDEQPATLVDVQDAVEPLVQQQSVEASDTAFDQKVQDLQSAVQRNEDIDISSIDLDASAANLFENERASIANSLKSQGITPTPGLIEANMAERFGPKSSQYGPEYTQDKKAMQIYATYGGEFGGDTVVVAGEQIPVSKLTTEYVSPGTAMSSESAREKAKDFLGNVRLDITNRRNLRRQDPELAAKELEFTQNEEVMNIAAANADMGRDVAFNESVYDAYDIKNEKLAKEIELQRGYSSSELNRLAGASDWNREEQQRITENFPRRLIDRFEEGQRIFFEADPVTGEPIPGTQELRSGRRSIEQKKGGGGRNTAEFSAGSRDDGGMGISTQEIIDQIQSTPSTQEYRTYQADQFGQKPNTGLTGVELEGAPFIDDRSQTGRKITREGIELTEPQPGTFETATNPFERLDNETLGMISLQGEEAEAVNATRILARRRREGVDTSKLGSPLQSQRVVVSEEPTEKGRQSILMSEAVRKAGYAPYTAAGKPRKQEPVRSSTLARTGRIESEVANLGAEMRGLRRAVESMDSRGQEERMGPRSRVAGLEPQQRTIPGVTGYAARQRPSEADKAAEQLESYMARLQRGRSTPLTSEVVIQPKLF